VYNILTACKVKSRSLQIGDIITNHIDSGDITTNNITILNNLTIPIVSVTAATPGTLGDVVFDLNTQTIAVYTQSGWNFVSLYPPATTDLYVSPSGSDTLNDGLSAASPFQTIEHANTPILIQGEVVDSGLNTLIPTGGNAGNNTVPASFSFSNITTSSVGVPADNTLQGWFVRFLPGSQAALLANDWVVSSQVTVLGVTTWTVCGLFGVVPTAADTFVVESPSTVITGTGAAVTQVRNGTGTVFDHVSFQLPDLGNLVTSLSVYNSTLTLNRCWFVRPAGSVNVPTLLLDSESVVFIKSPVAQSGITPGGCFQNEVQLNTSRSVCLDLGAHVVFATTTGLQLIRIVDASLCNLSQAYIENGGLLVRNSATVRSDAATTFLQVHNATSTALILDNSGEMSDSVVWITGASGTGVSIADSAQVVYQRENVTSTAPFVINHAQCKLGAGVITGSSGQCISAQFASALRINTAGALLTIANTSAVGNGILVRDGSNLNIQSTGTGAGALVQISNTVASTGSAIQVRGGSTARLQGIGDGTNYTVGLRLVRQSEADCVTTGANAIAFNNLAAGAQQITGQNAAGAFPGAGALVNDLVPNATSQLCTVFGT